MVMEKSKSGVFTVEVTKKGDEATPFEDALELIGVGRYSYTLFAICTIVLMAMATEIFGTSYTVSSSACDLHLDTYTRGLVSAMPMLGIVTSAHLWGWVADTRGRRTVLLISMGGGLLCAVACSFVTTWPALAAFKFASAFFASASNAVVYALFCECTPQSHRNKMVLYLSSGLMFSQSFMALNAYPVLRLDFNWEVLPHFHYRPWRLLQQVYGFWCGLSAILLLVFVKESPKFLASVGRVEESVRTLSELYALNTGRSADSYPVKKLKFEELHNTSKVNVLLSMWRQTTPLFRPPLLYNTLVITYVVIIVYAISPSFLMWTPFIVNAYSRALSESGSDASHSFCELLHSSGRLVHHNATGILHPSCNDKVEDLTFITLFIFSLVMALLNVLNSFVVKYVSKKSMVVGYHVMAGVCGLVLPWVTNLHASVLVFFLFQLNLVVMGLTTAFTVELYPTYLRAMAVCLSMMAGRGSTFLLITYVGELLEAHCATLFYVLGAYVLSGACVGMLLPSEQKRAPVKTDKS